MSPEMSAEGPAQGLFLCLPAGPADLSGFTSGTQTVPVAPGPLLAGLAEAVAGGDGAALAGVPEDALYAVIGAGRRMSSWATWLELAAMRELAVRHPEPRPAAQKQPAPKDQPAAQDRPAAQNPSDDGRVRFSEFIADEVALELRMTWNAATSRMTYACDLAGRLPVTFAALGAGLIDPVHAKIIYELTDILSAADAAKADPVLAAAAQHKTYGELRAHAARLVLKLDPDSAERRKQALRKREAHVRPFREESGNAGIIARELPSDEVLASWQHIEQRALDLRAAGIPGSL
jgi:hypothetical protein